VSERRVFAIESRGLWHLPDQGLDVIVTEDEMRATAGSATLVANFDSRGTLRVRMEGLETASPADVLRLTQALPHIRRRAGRPLNSGGWHTKAELEADLEKAADALRRSGFRVTNASLSRGVHAHASTVGRAARRFGVDLDALKRGRLSRDSA
jgi:hypothetical protein